jgi:predicted dehydrogenase
VSDAVRVGVVGAGAIAQVAHLGVLSRLKGVELVALADIDVPKAQALARRFHIPEVYDDIEDVLERARPDAVAVCTPNHLHEVHVLTALSAGVHVFCERPLALTSAGVAKVIKARERAARAVMVGMNYRYRSDVQALLGFLHGGELGALHGIRTGWYIWRPAGRPPGWRDRRPESGGGAMLDLGLPLVDLALWMASCPSPSLVTGWYGGRSGGGVEEAASAMILCREGLSIFVDVSWHHVAQAERFWFEAMGSAGSASLGPLRVFKEMHGAPMNVTPPAGQREDALSHSYRAEWVTFLAMVRGDAEPAALEDQVLLHRTMEAIAQSAGEGRAIAL